MIKIYVLNSSKESLPQEIAPCTYRISNIYPRVLAIEKAPRVYMFETGQDIFFLSWLSQTKLGLQLQFTD